MSGYPDIRRDLPWAPDAIKGYVGRRQQPSEGIHDPLLATALALEAGGTRAVIVGLDTLVVSAAFTDEVREALADDGVAPENVLVAASHTHSGPDLFAWWEGEPASAPATATVERTVCAARKALARLEKAELAVGLGSLDHVSVNRRDEVGGAIDPTVGVVRATSARDGSVLGLVVAFACHPVTLDYSNFLFSADYVWALRETLARAYPGAQCLFLNGAAGNINPARFPYEQRANIYVPQTLDNYPVYWGGFGDAGRLGRTLAGAAMQAAERALPVEVAAPTGRLVPVSLPLKRGAELEQYLDFMHFRSEAYRRSLTGRAELESSVQSLAIGSLRLLALPGEVFVEIGLELKATAGVEPLVLVGYADDDVRYVMTDDAYVAGQYETVGTPLAAGSASALATAARSALDAL